ncbi:hypothetical protein [Exiguobacterium sp. TNDT2]|uniref:hypothetical protein n=1 Tax=Exiguobacterium sp. TNDT2 TaxID=2233531 RepID=UPI000DEF7510|nr:hypothetical protein [Exiguobacterium sp. TNDT2]
MGERKSYLQMMSEGFQMMKKGRQVSRDIKLRDWTFSISRESSWHIILRTERLKWVSPSTDEFNIEPLFVQIGTLELTRHLETNEVRLTIDEEWGIESKVVCDAQEWERFVASLKQLKGE